MLNCCDKQSMDLVRYYPSQTLAKSVFDACYMNCDSQLVSKSAANVNA